MSTLLWLQMHMTFLQADWFPVVYGLVVFLNPIALIPQLMSSILKKPEKLGGVSIPMFIIFLMIQTSVSLGAIINSDVNLFWSMAISAVITSMIIPITLIRRR